jgi:murein DD-endopeptidase MepM/ murein hydrolase activator NlpD
MARELVLVLILAGVLLSGCVADPERAGRPTAETRPRDAVPCGRPGACQRPLSELAGPTHVVGGTSVAPTVSAQPLRRRFWVRDRRHYRSPWYAGAHRKMISFGCTAAPYYSPDPRCAHHHGFHHGLDIAMPCGTPLFSALRGRVLDPRSAGALGPSYGAHAFRIRSHRFHVDIVFGHTRRVFVRQGELVRRGERIALASDMGAPDGCHLHFEVRPPRASYQQAVDPHVRLQLRAVDGR